MRRRRWLWVMALAACGSSHPSSPSDAAIDADTRPLVTLQLDQVFVAATTSTAPFDVTGKHAAFIIDDGGTITELPAQQIAADTFGVHTDSLPEVHTDACPLATLALGVAATRASCTTYGAPDAQPPYPSSQLAVDLTLPAPYNGEVIELRELDGGFSFLFGQERPPSGATEFQETVAYSELSPVHRLSAENPLLVLERGTGGGFVAALVVPGFAQTSGTDSVVGTLAPVTQDRSFSFGFDTAGVQARLSALGYGTAYTQWSVAATPGPALATGMASGTTVSGTYGNPFPWPAIVTVSTSAAAANGAYAGITVETPADATGNLDTSVCLPTNISVSGSPSSGVRVTFTPDLPDNTLYTLSIQIVAPGGITAGSAAYVMATKPEFWVPASAFANQTGAMYKVSVGCIRGGYPNAASGDLQTFTLPMSTGVVSPGGYAF